MLYCLITIWELLSPTRIVYDCTVKAYKRKYDPFIPNLWTLSNP